ncbi:MAG TPA: exodeoxyribonuclease VII large subunit [Planctomycetota bacterium]|nr:exodeoxyribonuclease VII large subunit [Planctomycetota bacterium]
MNALSVYTVGQVTRAIRELLESSFPRLYVRGEVSNLSRPQSGHLYFSLLDDAPPDRSAARLTAAQLPCVAWRSSVPRLRARMENGQRIVACGRIGVYEPRGTYQLIVEQAEPAGLGELQRIFEELKERLRKEGLFSPERKKPLPLLPERIALVTSPTGAAIEDVMRVLYHRHPRAWVRVVPVRVQGEGAAEQIASAIHFLQSGGGQADVIVLARGGGSLEDLWAFNDEAVARAIAASSIPVISAVGHEVDFSISDFVADVRAQTPTQAAELLVPDLSDLLAELHALERRLGLSAKGAIESQRMALDRILRQRAFRDPQAWVQEIFERLDDVGASLRRHLYNSARGWDDSLSAIAGRLEALSPLKVLARGFSVLTGEDGRIVRDAAALRLGQTVRATLSRGRAWMEVTQVEA